MGKLMFDHNIMTRKFENGTELEVYIKIRNYNKNDESELRKAILKKANRMSLNAKNPERII